MIRWTHPSLHLVEGFRVFYGPEPGFYTGAIDVGFALSVEFDLAPGETCWVAVVAYAGPVESAPSNERALVGTAAPANGPPCHAAPVWSEDFEAHAPGTFVAGWFDTWAASWEARDFLFFGGDGILSTYSPYPDIHSHFGGDGGGLASAEWQDYEVRARVRISSDSAAVGITSHSSYPIEAAYYRLGRPGGAAGAFVLSALPPGSPCEGLSTGVVATPGGWYWLALEVVDVGLETRTRAKAWPAGAPEPSEWAAVCVDGRPQRPASGTVGAWSAGVGIKDWDDFQVRFVEGGGSP